MVSPWRSSISRRALLMLIIENRKSSTLLMLSSSHITSSLYTFPRSSISLVLDQMWAFLLLKWIVPAWPVGDSESSYLLLWHYDSFEEPWLGMPWCRSTFLHLIMASLRMKLVPSSTESESWNSKGVSNLCKAITDLRSGISFSILMHGVVTKFHKPVDLKFSNYLLLFRKQFSLIARFHMY